MIAINLQCRARQLFATSHQRSQLMHGTRPDGWQIFTGGLLDDRFGGTHFNRSLLTSIGLGGDQSLPLVCCYFVIERVAFLTFSSIGERTLDLALLSCGASGRPMPLRSLTSDPAEIPGDWMFITLEHLNAIQEWFGPIARDEV